MDTIVETPKRGSVWYYHNNPEYKKKVIQMTNDLKKHKLETDPEYAKRTLKKQAEWYRNKYNSDPEFREKRREQCRLANARRRAAQKLQQEVPVT